MTTEGPQPCLCAKARHVHGTRAAYTADKCRCFPCRVAHANSVRTYRNGGTWREAARPAVHGTRRRLQALACIGYTKDAVAAHTGISPLMVSQLRSVTIHPTVSAGTAERVSAAYDALWDKPIATANGRRCSTQARRYGWVPPLAWDDESIDDPDAAPAPALSDEGFDVDEVAVDEAASGRRVPLTRAEYAAAVAVLTGRGYSADQAAERLGSNSRRVCRARAAARREDAA